MSMLWYVTKGATGMTPPKATTDTQLYRVLAALDKNGNMTLEDLSKETGYPIPSLRRTISDLKRTGRIRKQILYGLR